MCKILFKVTISILHADTVFLLITQGGDMESSRGQNISETSPADFLLYSPNFSHTHTHLFSTNNPHLSVLFSLFLSLTLHPSLPFSFPGGVDLRGRRKDCPTHTHVLVNTHYCTHCSTLPHTCEALARPCLINDTRHCVRREGWVCDVWCGR